MSWVSITLRCKESGIQWKTLHEKGKPLPRCEACAGKSQQGLSAPGIARGAAPATGIEIPKTHSAREQLAGDLYLAGTGHSDIQRGLREGDIAVKTLKTP